MAPADGPLVLKHVGLLEVYIFVVLAGYGIHVE
jgi:hypothetical protein